MVENKIRMVIAALWERDRQAERDQREAEERGRRVGEKRRWMAEQIEILGQVLAELGMSDDETDETDGTTVSPRGGGVGNPSVDRPAYERGSVISEILGPNFQYFTPDRDGDSNEPIYSVSVVSGKRNSRERALAAARVYGPDLREMSLADAIFRTGETRAADAVSVRGSLGGLVKYGTDWRRERGTLIYQGDGLQPDWETIRRLTEARNALRQQACQEEDFSHFESL